MDRTATAEPEEDKEEAAAIREVVSIAGVRLAERACVGRGVVGQDGIGG